MHGFNFDDIFSVLIWLLIIVNALYSILKKDKKKKKIEYYGNSADPEINEEDSLWDSDNFAKEEKLNDNSVSLNVVSDNYTENKASYQDNFSLDTENTAYSEAKKKTNRFSSYLSTKGNMKKAIVLSEILNKPKALRKNG